MERDHIKILCPKCGEEELQFKIKDLEGGSTTSINYGGYDIKTCSKCQINVVLRDFSMHLILQ